MEILIFIFITAPLIFIGLCLLGFIFQLVVVGIVGLFFKLYDLIRSIAT